MTPRRRTSRALIVLVALLVIGGFLVLANLLDWGALRV